MDKLPGQVDNDGINPSSGIIELLFNYNFIVSTLFWLGVVVEEPKPHDNINDKFQGLVGLEELAKTDRILVQQVSLTSLTCVTVFVSHKYSIMIITS